VKVKVVANELVETDIEMVSLVKHGANRAPFRILKADEDGPAAKLGEKLQSFFSLAKGEVAVAAYFIRKDATEAMLPILKAQGVDVGRVTEADGVTVVTVSDASPKGFIQLGDALAVAISHPLKEFSDESIVKAYADGVGLSGFAPGVGLATRGLADAVWSLLNSSDGDEGAREERIAKVDSMLASFRKYITSLSKMLPDQVLKVEAAARSAHTEETDMPKGKLDEAVAGDLDGLLKTEEVAPATTTTTAEVTATTTDTITVTEPAVSDSVITDAKVTKTEQPDALAAILAKLSSFDEKLDAVAKSVKDQQVITDSLAAQVAETRTDLAKAEDVARRTTLVDRGGDMDLALSTLGGSDNSRSRRPVAKSGEALWDGLFSDLDSFRPSR